MVGSPETISMSSTQALVSRAALPPITIIIFPAKEVISLCLVTYSSLMRDNVFRMIHFTGSLIMPLSQAFPGDTVVVAGGVVCVDAQVGAGWQVGAGGQVGVGGQIVVGGQVCVGGQEVEGGQS